MSSLETSTRGEWLGTASSLSVAASTRRWENSMNIKQMFPRRKLDAEDLHAYSQAGVVVTIESIDFRTLHSDKPGDPEIEYLLKVVEFKKPFKLNATCGRQIADLIDTEDTQDWPGNVIRIVPCRVQAFGKMIWVINAEPVTKHERPTLAPNNDITGFAMVPEIDRVVKYLPGARAAKAQAALPAGVIGVDTALKMISGLHERGKKWDDFTKHLKTEGAGASVEGKLPCDCSADVLEWARSYCKMFGKVNPPLSAPQLAELRASWVPPAPPANSKPPGMGGDVVDPETGDVLTDEDIPF
jgi:hypothetical protein